MPDRLGDLVLRLLRVPPPPEAPRGSPGSTHVFRAAPGFLYRRLIEWGLAQAGALAGIAFGLGFASGDFLPERLDALVGPYLRWFEVLSLALFALQFTVSLAILLLDFKFRWYLVTDRSLRIREGIVRVREQTVSFANIQNVSVKQGPLQRLLGIADLEIRTAGGGESTPQGREGDHLHRAVFRGVANAGQIRDLIRQDLRRLRDSESEAAPQAPETSSLADAARQLADAAQALRSTLAAR